LYTDKTKKNTNKMYVLTKSKCSKKKVIIIVTNNLLIITTEVVIWDILEFMNYLNSKIFNIS